MWGGNPDRILYQPRPNLETVKPFWSHLDRVVDGAGPHDAVDRAAGLANADLGDVADQVLAGAAPGLEPGRAVPGGRPELCKRDGLRKQSGHHHPSMRVGGKKRGKRPDETTNNVSCEIKLVVAVGVASGDIGTNQI